MNKISFELNKEYVRNLLRSQPMMDVLLAEANAHADVESTYVNTTRCVVQCKNPDAELQRVTKPKN